MDGAASRPSDAHAQLGANRRAVRTAAAPGQARRSARHSETSAAGGAARYRRWPTASAWQSAVSLPNRSSWSSREQKLLRAVYSERQLQEVLDRLLVQPLQRRRAQGRVRFMLTEYEREAIRPHVLGQFRDLLGATAKSPAMLFYLDNWMSADPSLQWRIVRQRRRVAEPAPRLPPQAQNRTPRGLNENYGRELLELHTLGVDGGYTQKDVTEVARAFTGWTIGSPRERRARPSAGPVFRRPAPSRRWGEGGARPRLRTGGGVGSDGEQVLDILAAHPSTARFNRDQAGAAVRQRHAAGGAGRSGCRQVHGEPEATCAKSCARCCCRPSSWRRPARTRQGQDAARVRRERAARHRRDRRERPASRPHDAGAGHAALPVPAADRLQGHGGRLGEHRRARRAA